MQEQRYIPICLSVAIARTKDKEESLYSLQGIGKLGKVERDQIKRDHMEISTLKVLTFDLFVFEKSLSKLAHTTKKSCILGSPYQPTFLNKPQGEAKISYI